jgi:hypothetical protein
MSARRRAVTGPALTPTPGTPAWACRHPDGGRACLTVDLLARRRARLLDLGLLDAGRACLTLDWLCSTVGAPA